MRDYDMQVQIIDGDDDSIIAIKKMKTRVKKLLKDNYVIRDCHIANSDINYRVKFTFTIRAYLNRKVTYEE